MEKHTCKLCFRRFSNGRALGGHMRSHVAAAAAAGVAASASVVAPAGDSSTSSREAEEDELGDGKGLVLSYGLRENPRKSFRLVDPEFSSSLAAVDAGSSVVQDLESETESPRPVPCHRRRSKRSRRFPPPPPDPEPVSSVSDTTPEEDVAISLMLLSRDVWTKSAEAEESSDGDDDESEDEQIVAGSGRGGRDSGERRRSRFQCETCKKVFRSYQALGGHRASHKKLKQSCSPAAAVKTRIPEANADRKVHECPVCFRVFGSGQALGGHKRSHLSSSSPSLPPPPSPATAKLGGENLIDLNLPAPMDEDAAELSAVSDASEFVVGNLPSY